MPSPINKFNILTRNLLAGVHNFTIANTTRVMLTNNATIATMAVKADVTEIAAGNGYPAGGVATAAVLTTAAGVAKLTLADVTFTASGGDMPEFRYIVVYDDTPTTPTKPLIAWIDYGSSLTLKAADSLTIDFDDAAGALTFA